MAKIKIGEKEYEVTITNRTIRAIEKAFNGTSIEELMSNEKMSATDLGDFIHPTICEHIEFEEFLDDMLPSQYMAAATIVGGELARSFSTGVKKN